MCGVFGFVSRDGGKMNLKALGRVAAVTERRGPHAFGFAWIDRRGRLKCFKQTGRITDHLGLLTLAADATLLIGHCRFATQGDPGQNINNHPHPADGGWLVHNGRVPNYGRLLDEHDLYPAGACDSEVLGLLIERGRGSLLERCRRAVLAVSDREDGERTLFALPQPLVLLGLWPRPGRLVAVRRGNPLHAGRADEGDYLASLAEGLPGAVTALADHAAYLFTPKETTHAAL